MCTVLAKKSNNPCPQGLLSLWREGYNMPQIQPKDIDHEAEHGNTV